jgi:hypothetical protein
MATDRRSRALIFAILVLGLSFLHAEDDALPLLEEQESDSYSYSLKDDGTPLFSQNITWDAVEFVRTYELEIQDSEGREIYRNTSGEPKQTVSLRPGTYQYRITLYNLLDKPELKSQWLPLVVIKAEHPVIDSFYPGTIFLDEENFGMTVYGDDLMEGARVLLVDAVLGIGRYQATVETNGGNKKLEILLPWNKLDTGLFKIKVINAGGLYTVSDATVRVKLNNPFELFAVTGLAPYIPLLDSSYTQVWADQFYPLGAQARISFVFSKKRYGYYGAELYASTKFIQTTTGSDITIDMNTTNVNLGLMFKYRFSQEWFALIRAGAGMSLTTVEFTYSNVAGLSSASMDPNIAAGLAVQYLMRKHWLFEGGVDYLQIFYAGQSGGGLVPTLSAGYLF